MTSSSDEGPKRRPEPEQEQERKLRPLPRGPAAAAVCPARPPMQPAIRTSVSPRTPHLSRRTPDRAPARGLPQNRPLHTTPAPVAPPVARGRARSALASRPVVREAQPEPDDHRRRPCVSSLGSTTHPSRCASARASSSSAAFCFATFATFPSCRRPRGRAAPRAPPTARPSSSARPATPDRLSSGTASAHQCLHSGSASLLAARAELHVPASVPATFASACASFQLASICSTTVVCAGASTFAISAMQRR
jgi:hypothetical protein